MFEVKLSGGKDIQRNKGRRGDKRAFNAVSVDTASAVSIVGENTYYKYLRNLALQEPQINLNGYTGHDLNLLGQVDMAVKYEDQEKVLPLVIAKGKRTSLFGRSWMRFVKLNWESIFSVKVSSLDEILKKYSSVFTTGEIRLIKEFQAHIELKEGAISKVHKERPVPYALKEEVETD